MLSRPNVIVYVVDDMPVDGTSPQAMPLFAEGGWLTFPHAYVHDPLCGPSRASLLTGLYSVQHGVVNNVEGAALDATRTVATALKAIGYSTGLFGKYLNRYGARYAYPAPLDANGYPSRRPPPGWDRWFAFWGAERYYDYTVNDAGTLRAWGSRPRDYSTDVVASTAADWIRTAPEPFFAYVAPKAPHNDKRHPQGFAYPAPRHENVEIALKRRPSFNEADIADKPQWYQDAHPLQLDPVTIAAYVDPDHVSRLRAMRAVDDLMRGVAGELDARGAAGRTVEIFLTDNATTFGEHRSQRKGWIYRECTDPRLHVRYPGVAGGVRRQLVSNLDVAPTVAALAGATLQRTPAGKNLTPCFTDPTFNVQTSIYLWHGDLGKEQDPNALGMPQPFDGVVRYYDGRLVSYYEFGGLGAGQFEGYDHQIDPYELQNTGPARRAELRNLLLSKRDEAQPA